LNGCDKFILLVRNNLFAPHYHVDKVVSHIEDRVSAVDQSVLMVEEAFEEVKRKLSHEFGILLVDGVFLVVLEVGEESSSDAVVFINCTLLDN
jgi:hypothetical protein